MPTRDEILNERTHRDADSIGQRVFYVLDEQDGRIRASAHAKLMGLLIEHLHSKGALTDVDIDDLLYGVVTT